MCSCKTRRHLYESSVTSVREFGQNYSRAVHQNIPSLLGRCKQKQRGLRGLLCRWPSITEWEMHITAQGCRLRNDLYCVEWDVKLYYTIPYHLTLHVDMSESSNGVTVKVGLPYSKRASGSGPELIPVLGSQPAGDRNHKPGGRLRDCKSGFVTTRPPSLTGNGNIN